MFVNRLTLAITAWLASFTAAVCAQPADPGLQSLPAIRASATRAVGGVIDAALPGVELEAMALDARLRLPACQGRLDTFVTAPRHNQARVPVRVSCSTPAWMVHVPVEIRRAHSVLVLRRAVARGERITAADVASQTRVLPGLGSPFVSSLAQLEGRLARRLLAEGTALPADALTVALLIHRGQAVTLVARTAGFEVRAPGRALSDAAAQQRVRVQNLNSLKIIEGIADSVGVVRVLP
jgi:flagellar basal body P-ring formation protein FlgA